MFRAIWRSPPRLFVVYWHQEETAHTGENTTMETRMVYELLALVGLAMLWALQPTRSVPPQIICVVAEPTQEQGGMGCVLPVIVVVVIVVALWMLAGG